MSVLLVLAGNHSNMKTTMQFLKAGRDIEMDGHRRRENNCNLHDGNFGVDEESLATGRLQSILALY